MASRVRLAFAAAGPEAELFAALPRVWTEGWRVGHAAPRGHILMDFPLPLPPLCRESWKRKRAAGAMSCCRLWLCSRLDCRACSVSDRRGDSLGRSCRGRRLLSEGDRVRQGAHRRLRPRFRGGVRQTHQPARPARRHLILATPLALREGPKPDTITNPSLSPPGPTSTSRRSVTVLQESVRRAPGGDLPFTNDVVRTVEKLDLVQHLSAARRSTRLAAPS